VRGITHTWTNTAGWLTGVVVFQATTGRLLLAPMILGGALVVATSRLPDIDHPDSGPGRRMSRLLPGFPQLLKRAFGVRRSPTHWGGVAVCAGILTGSLASVVSPSLWWVGLAIGGSWLAHIAGDCLTWQGAPLYAPLSLRMIRPRRGNRFECGGTFERRLVQPAAMAWCLLAGVGATWPVLSAFYHHLSS
jgi:hypothetical protein